MKNLTIVPHVEGDTETVKYVLTASVKGKSTEGELRAKLHEAKQLLTAANCPGCGDKSGAYYDNYGEVCQCQWCDEVSKL